MDGKTLLGKVQGRANAADAGPGNNRPWGC
jgi:hypothetical protein